MASTKIRHTRNPNVPKQLAADITLGHIYSQAEPRFNVKIEKNSRGFNYEISYSGENLDEVIERIAEGREKIENLFPGAVETSTEGKSKAA